MSCLMRRPPQLQESHPKESQRIPKNPKESQRIAKNRKESQRILPGWLDRIPPAQFQLNLNRTHVRNQRVHSSLESAVKTAGCSIK